MSAKLKPLSELTGSLATLDAAKPAPGQSRFAMK